MLRLAEVGKTFSDGTVAVRSLSLDFPDGTTTMLLGSSGSGKTTTLRMINRMIERTSGEILVDGRDVRSVPEHELRRSMGYVIQQAGLFPHRMIIDNVMTVPRLLGWDKATSRARALELLELVGLDPSLARRYPAQLSGGQQQRVGVARALAADPPVLLMDEPFGAVDPIVRQQLQVEFGRLQSELHKTVVFVTHDVSEAVQLGDRIAVLGDGGALQQVATPTEMLMAPANAFVADFLGADRRLTLFGLVAAGSVPMRPLTDVPSDVSAAELPHVPVASTARSPPRRRSRPSQRDGSRGRRRTSARRRASLRSGVCRRSGGSHVTSLVASSAPPNWSGAQYVGNWDVVWYWTQVHVRYTVVALALGCAVALPLGYLARRRPATYAPMLVVTNALYAVPSIAMFVLLAPALGFTNDKPVVAAMAIYSLVILVRNLVESLRAVPSPVVDAATAMGIGPFRRFVTVELPMAAPGIVAGLRVAAVSTISLISVGAVVGRGGLGRLFDDGFQRRITEELVAGLVAIVLLALVADLLIVGTGRLMTPWTRHTAPRRRAS